MNEFYKIALNPSPKDFKLAFAPINNAGAVGTLNSKILLEFGFTENIVRDLRLSKGSDIFEQNDKKIIFVVTIEGEKDAEILLRDNLSKAFSIYAEEISGKECLYAFDGYRSCRP